MRSQQREPGDDRLRRCPPDADVGTRAYYSFLGEEFERARVSWLRTRDAPLENSFIAFRDHLKDVLADIVRNTPLQHYTDHSLVHSRVNMGILSCLLEHPRLVSQKLTEAELWGLLFAAYLHDHRMVTGARAGHENISTDDLGKLPGLLDLLAGIGIPVEAVQRICQLHSSKTKFDKPDVVPLRTSLLGALMRMADSLDYTAARLPTDEFLVGKSISRTGILEYRKQECVRGIVIDGGLIEVLAWFDFGNLHLIRDYFRKDYPDGFLAPLGIEFTYRFSAAEAPPPKLREYSCSDDARVFNLTSADELARVAEDSAYLDTTVTGILSGLADWQVFRRELAVPELFTIAPEASAAMLLRPGLHVITGPPGSGKSVFLLLVLEVLLNLPGGPHVTVRVLPRLRFAEALQGIADEIMPRMEGGNQQRVLLVIDSLNIDDDIDHLRDGYGKLWEAIERGHGSLSAVITLADDEWKVLAGVRAGALVQTLGPGRPKGLLQLLGRAMKARRLRPDGVSEAEINGLGTNGQSSSPNLAAFADRVLSAADGSPSYITALLDELAAKGTEFIGWSAHDLPAGVVALRRRVLERFLAIGQTPFMATILLLEKAVDGLSEALLDRLAESRAAAAKVSVEPTHRFRVAYCEEMGPGRQRLSRGWRLAVQSWRRSASAASRLLHKQADIESAAFIDSLYSSLEALDSAFRLQLFDDLISLRRYAQAFDILQDRALIPDSDRPAFERHLREAWRNEYGERHYGLIVDPLEHPLLAECLERLLCDDRRPSLCTAVENDPGLSNHPLTLLYRAECGRLALASFGQRPATPEKEAVNALYESALRAAREFDSATRLQLAVKVQHGLFLYDICGERDAAGRVWNEVEMATRQGAGSRVRALALHYLGRSAFHSGRWQETDRFYMEAWEILSCEGDYVLLSRLGTSMADAWAFMYNLPLAEERIAFCLNVKRLIGDLLGEAASLGVRANLEARRGDYSAAIRDFREDLRILESVDTTGTLSHIRTKMAEAFLKAGDLTEAEKLLLGVERSLGGPDTPPSALGFCWKGLAKVRLAQGNPVDAAWRVERLLRACPGSYLTAFLLRLAARLRAAGHWPESEPVDELLDRSRALFARESLLSEEAVCELYRPLLSADSTQVRPACRQASSLLSQQVAEVSGAGTTLGPIIERLDAIAKRDLKTVQEVEVALRQLITFLEY